MQDSLMLLELARVVLPEEFICNFKIVGINRLMDTVEFTLDESARIPKSREGHNIESKGFLPAVTIHDFPLRESLNRTTIRLI